jgi:hypothetical protein
MSDSNFAGGFSGSKIATDLGAVALALCLAAGPAIAAKSGSHGSGHPSGGGHPGGGAHFSAHAAPHFSAHVTPHFTPHIASSPVTPSSVHPLATTVHPLVSGVHPLAAGAHLTPLAHVAFRGDPHDFLAHRRFAGDPAFRPFLGHGWHPYHHLGWVGPLFWPYAYGDLFYYALWPADYGYDDPFWYYGYGDIYGAIFSPYSYDEYVQGSDAPARMAGLTQSMAQSCADEAAEVTSWPIDQIQSAVQPSGQQNALLDNLGNAVVKASDEIKSNCPTTVAFTPTDRLGQMKVRLQSLVDAVNIISPALDKFYDSLSDEQKARFNDMAPPQQAQAPQGGQAPPTMTAQCDAKIMAWPSDQIDAAVKPDDAQRAKLAALTSAAAQAADAIKAACPSELPATPPSRLAAIGSHLQAMLQAVETVQPVLADFYDSLSDDQKARFNAVGKQLFASNQE